MNKRRARRHQEHRPAGLLGAWTIPRASGIGIMTGMVGLLIAALFETDYGALLYPYALLLAVTALCGASILWITMFDMRRRGTSGRMRPIRTFDVALGLAFLVPALYALWLDWSALGL